MAAGIANKVWTVEEIVKIMTNKVKAPTTR
jgi:hypothetical protein